MAPQKSSQAATRKPLWRCPSCRRSFANRNQSHFCGRYTLQSHFRGKTAAVRQLYVAFLEAVRRYGPVKVLPEKSRIAFQVRMSFAAIQIQTSKIIGHLVLAERHEQPLLFHRIDSLSPHNHVHHFRIGKPEDLTPEFCGLIARAYAVGRQEHLQGRSHP